MPSWVIAGGLLWLFELGVCPPVLWYLSAHTDGHASLASVVAVVATVVAAIGFVTTIVYAGALGWIRRWVALLCMIIAAACVQVDWFISALVFGPENDDAAGVVGVVLVLAMPLLFFALAVLIGFAGWVGSAVRRDRESCDSRF